ncbi:hypothetical protein [Aquipseudomonas alcaligenes]|jgi:hypothetical protein|uniref:Uncharacterized protein n=1 Tax=Aquipseudomonas alcaligenes (strain ATCC 14909 / DSM 50342 / CCUG 1425 / JCM 20561 / NBRC 14159 / NCIMB 9945 / NCTC 10367 / 1577) TaxID=1215092 RepID=U2ZSB1_AQUA1|nr:hypothetical protein [Pseudomonas alcaligenes]GAD63972.1 hypothetical protein PA6_031_00650 [Pseudomonas alcaligenes NBRC 14159]SUD13160.1 Uncharacterised protein [Pseudomonas alcaligenes]
MPDSGLQEKTTPTHNEMILIIIAYLSALLVFATYSIGAMGLGWLPAPYAPLRVPLMCGAIAYVGGALYCFRAIYLNKCVYKRWDPDWHVWYFIRPLTSTIAGAVSYLFLKAGLLVLESSSNAGASEVGFFALAFIAGFNVDKFVAKIEEVAKAVWGIEKSRSAQVRTSEPSRLVDTVSTPSPPDTDRP